ncbi:hypothetical protein GCM10009422_25280 [Brevundimonas kwangchunensis]|uniref:Uncharacterized protein n=1 Tax=Brevundimonas kwangchunensis TaxID=322163 RepID=A0ABP3SBV3_9CAUL
MSVEFIGRFAQGKLAVHEDAFKQSVGSRDPPEFAEALDHDARRRRREVDHRRPPSQSAGRWSVAAILSAARRLAKV